METSRNLMETSWKPPETSWKPPETQSNGRVNPTRGVIQPWRSLRAVLHVCSDTPRFSYGTSKTTTLSGNDGSTGGAREGVRAGYGTRDGYTGWVAGWVIPGPVPTQPAARKEVPRTAKRAPEGLQGLEWVVRGAGCVRASDPTTPDPAGPPGPLRWV